MVTSFLVEMYGTIEGHVLPRRRELIRVCEEELWLHVQFLRAFKILGGVLAVNQSVACVIKQLCIIVTEFSQ